MGTYGCNSVRQSRCRLRATWCTMSADLRVLATTRLEDARALLLDARFSGAYYLAGYAVECGLKAVIVRSWQADFAGHGLPGKSAVLDTYVHDLSRLVGVANLGGRLGTEAAANAQFRDNWDVVKDWNEASRYELWTGPDAESIVAGVGDPKDGVLRWLRTLW